MRPLCSLYGVLKRMYYFDLVHRHTLLWRRKYEESEGLFISPSPAVLSVVKYKMPPRCLFSFVICSSVNERICACLLDFISSCDFSVPLLVWVNHFSFFLFHILFTFSVSVSGCVLCPMFRVLVFIILFTRDIFTSSVFYLIND